MEPKFGVRNLIAIILVVVGSIFLITGPSFTPARQVSDTAGSAIDFSGKTVDFIWAAAVILGGIIAVGAGLTVVFWLLVRQVKQANSLENEPANPLDYTTYGHPMAVVLVGGIFAVLALFFLSFDLLPVQATEEAKVVDRFFMIEFITIAFIFGLVVGLLVHTLLFFHARKGEEWSDGKHFHGHVPLELFWTFTPLIFVMILGVVVVDGISAGPLSTDGLVDILEEKDGEQPIFVVGFQWGWRYYYPTDLFFTPEELAELDPDQQQIIQQNERLVRNYSGLEGYGVQTGEVVLLMEQPVVIEMTSDDVLHNFWVPEFRMKRDAAPGVITELRYTPILEGEYRIRCAELCGLLHYNMYGDVRVVSQNDYDNWLESVKLSFGNPVLAGQAIHQANCLSCHSVNGDAGTGPTWLNSVGYVHEMANGEEVLVDYDYVLESIWFPNSRIVAGYPSGLMPANYRDVFSEPQIRQVFAYMCSISDKWQEVEDCQEYAPQIQEARGETPAEAPADVTASVVDGNE